MEVDEIVEKVVKEAPTEVSNGFIFVVPKAVDLSNDTTAGNMTLHKVVNTEMGQDFYVSAMAVNHAQAIALRDYIKANMRDDVRLSYSLYVRGETARVMYYLLNEKENDCSKRYLIPKKEDLDRYVFPAVLRDTKSGIECYDIIVEKNKVKGNIDEMGKVIDQLLAYQRDFLFWGGLHASSGIGLPRSIVNSPVVGLDGLNDITQHFHSRQTLERSKESLQMLFTKQYVWGLGNMVSSVNLARFGYNPYTGKRPFDDKKDLLKSLGIAELTILNTYKRLSRVENENLITPLVAVTTDKALTTASVAGTINPASMYSDYNGIAYINYELLDYLSTVLETNEYFKNLKERIKSLEKESGLQVYDKYNKYKENAIRFTLRTAVNVL